MRNWRINLIFVFFILLAAVLIGRLIYIQILQADLYRALAQGFLFFNPSSEIQIERGEIFLRDGEPLAINKNFFLVFASPPNVKNIGDTAEILSEVLNLNKDFVSAALQKETLYSPIKNRLSQEEIETLKNLNLPGIYLAEERGRYYPQETLASQVVGFLGASGIGQYGLEEYYDSILQDGGRRDHRGEDLILTLDYNVQFRAERLLERAKENLAIEAGQIIVMDPNSGKIIALAHFPNFNPNEYRQYALAGNLEIFRNRAGQDFFEPGSVFKSIIMAAGLNEELITPATIYLDEGYVKIGGHTLYNFDRRVWGEETMTRVLDNSINTGAVFVQKLLENEAFVDYIEKFGIFEKTGIDLPESLSENKEFKEGREINFATASYGQGIEMTAIQLARAYAAIANNGQLVNPHLVENLAETRPPPELPLVISPKAAGQLTAMLVSVVEQGSARRAKIPGYYIAAKTGTSQIAYSALGIPKPGYSEKTVQAVAGFFPAFSPQFVILVKLDNPQTRVAEYSAVPIFRELTEYIIHQYQIPPDYNL